MLHGGRARMHGPWQAPAMLEWDDLRYFLAVHRARSHAGAARILRVAPTTIGRRIAALEVAVGARLFARTPDGLAATAASRSLLARAERMEAEAFEAERELAGADARPTGTVRVTCGDGLATYLIAPALPDFLAAYPGLTVEVRADVRALDLTRGEADVALRNFRPRERSLIARRLGIERQGLYAAPSYLARRGTPRTARDLAAHQLVLYDREMDRMRTQAWLLQSAAGAHVAVRASSTTLVRAACGAGAGVALLSTIFVRGDPRFEQVLPRLEAPPIELWAVTHGDLRASARVTAVLRWLERLVVESGVVP
jgi:DNA-binding transcriptional LysR family regulator